MLCSACAQDLIGVAYSVTIATTSNYPCIENNI